jgi:hypothetical protein
VPKLGGLSEDARDSFTTPQAIINSNGYFKVSNVEFCKLFGRNFNKVCKLNITGIFAIFDQ